MKWSRSAWASAEPSVGSVPAPSSSSRTSVSGSGRLDDPGDRAQVTRERRQALGDRLLVADVGEDVAEHRQARAGLGRDVEAGLVHEREQAERAQGDRLAARVRPGHHERRVAIAEPDVDRHDPPAQPGVAGARAGRPRAGRPSRPGWRPSPRPGAPWPPTGRTGPARRATRAAGRRCAATSADSSSRIRSISSRSATWASRQALPSSTATSGSTNRVWPLPDASWTIPFTRLRASALTGTT